MSVVQFLCKLDPLYPRAVLCVVNPFLFWVFAARRYAARDWESGQKRDCHVPMSVIEIKFGSHWVRISFSRITARNKHGGNLDTQKRSLITSILIPFHKEDQRTTYWGSTKHTVRIFTRCFVGIHFLHLKKDRNACSIFFSTLPTTLIAYDKCTVFGILL